MLNYQSIVSKVFIPHYDCERPINWAEEFQGPKPIHVEIGFGQGEFLLRSVLDHPDVVYVGIELDWSRVKKCFKKIARLNPEEQEIIFKNLRILHIDAWDVFERIFLPQTVAHIECLFPCPWPKDSHEKHRLFSNDFLKLINSRLHENGDIHFVTDFWRYVDWIMEQQAGTGFEILKNVIPAKFGTKFERKWVAGGQDNFCELTFHKKKHMNIAVKEDVELKAYYHKSFCPEKFLLEKEINDGIAIVPKEWIYDEEQNKGVARLVVSEGHLTQHVWIIIVKTKKGWCVLRSEGQQVLSTPGIARAIEMVSESVQKVQSE